MYFSVEISMNSCKEFVDYWKKKYRYPNETVYKCHIGEDLTREYESLEKLFVWKFGRGGLFPSQQINIDKKIEWLKSDSVKNCTNKQIIEKAENKYLNRKEGGAIWNIFFLHCLDREKWPIYDQHTYRAMKFIKTGEIPEDENNDYEKYENYRKKYIPFFKSMVEECKPREVDKALFAFGKFLKTYEPDSRRN